MKNNKVNEKFNGVWHAYERAEERLEYTGERANRLFSRAWERGKRYSNYENGKSKNYLQKKSVNGITAVSFGDSIFIFDEKSEMCITCYKAPKWFGQKKHVKAHIRFEEAIA